MKSAPHKSIKAMIAIASLTIGTATPMSHRASASHCTPALKFTKHSFGARCFNTRSCRVDYADFREIDMPNEISPAPTTDYIKSLTGTRGGITNFPRPAEINWTSLDGTHLNATIDMRKIFPDECIAHNTLLEDIPEKAYVGSPSILLVVNDRNIQIYIKAMIPLKKLRNPSNPHSDFAWDAISVFSKDF